MPPSTHRSELSILNAPSGPPGTTESSQETTAAESRISVVPLVSKQAGDPSIRFSLRAYTSNDQVFNPSAEAVQSFASVQNVADYFGDHNSQRDKERESLKQRPRSPTTCAADFVSQLRQNATGALIVHEPNTSTAAMQAQGFRPLTKDELGDLEYEDAIAVLKRQTLRETGGSSEVASDNTTEGVREL
jgi:hypothetical protein